MLGRLGRSGAGPGAMRWRWPLLAGALIVALGALTAVGILLSGDTREQASTGAAAIGGPFRLTDQNGARVTPQDFSGRYMLIYFGYTYCPDVCPLTLANMTQALDLLPEDEAEKVVPIFITVDPERDTVEQLAEYAPSFGPDLVALTGTDAEIKAATRAYRVYFNKVENDEVGAYLMDHSGFVYLMGPDGKYRTHFSHSTTPEEMAEAIRETVDEG